MNADPKLKKRKVVHLVPNDSSQMVVQEDEWKKLFAYYIDILNILRDRKRVFSKSDREELRAKTDNFQHLYISRLGTKAVSIYFKILFQGVLEQQLEKFGNIAYLDQESAEGNQKTTKTIIRDNTNLNKPALDFIRVCSANLVLLVETDFKHYPDSAHFKSCMEQISNMKKPELKKLNQGLDVEAIIAAETMTLVLGEENRNGMDFDVRDENSDSESDNEDGRDKQDREMDLDIIENSNL